MVTDLWRKAETRLIDENPPAGAPDGRKARAESRICAHNSRALAYTGSNSAAAQHSPYVTPTPTETIFASRVCAPRALPRPVASLCRWMPICWWELLPHRRSRGTPSRRGWRMIRAS